jgi:hypothetical protein
MKLFVTPKVTLDENNSPNFFLNIFAMFESQTLQKIVKMAVSFYSNYHTFLPNVIYSKGSDFIRRQCPCRSVAFRTVFHEFFLKARTPLRFKF